MMSFPPISEPCSSESRSLDSLPEELLCRILRFLRPRDVIQLRLVSKFLHSITYDPVIWRAIYADARLPRPPGPYPSQPTHFLEKTLIRSERLAECWTTQPIQAISRTEIRLGGLPLLEPRIIGSKWLVSFESCRQLVFYNIETRSQQMVWEDEAMIRSWDACSTMTSGGILIYVILRQSSELRMNGRWRLLELNIDSVSAQISHSVTLDVPAKYLVNSASLVGGSTPFLYITGQHLVFDTRTRTFYEFPEFSTELHEARADLDFTPSRTVLPTNTHIIAVLHRSGTPSSRRPPPKWTLVQAFTASEDSRLGDQRRILHLSHEGAAVGCLSHLTLIQNSTPSAIGSTCLRFLRADPKTDCLQFSCVDVALQNNADASFGAVLPAFIDAYDIFTVERGIHRPFMSPYYVGASDDGYVRGFCRNRSENDNGDGDGSMSGWSSSNLPPRITKFSIDVPLAGDKCVATVGQASPLRWVSSDSDPLCFSKVSFDGAVGRICYIKGGNNWRLHGFADAVVIDVK